MQFRARGPSPALLRAAGLVVAGSIALIAFRDVAQAQNYTYMVDDPLWNPNGMQSSMGNVFGASVPWITAGTTVGICADWNFYNYNAAPQGLRDAVAAWENVTSGTQMSTGCGTT